MNNRVEEQPETIILKCKPSILFYITEPLGTLLFGGLGYIMINLYLNGKVSFPLAGGIVAAVIFWAFAGVLFGIAFYCLGCLIGARTIVLTDKNFIIKRPLLSMQRSIPLNNIEDVKQGVYKSKTMLPHTTGFSGSADTVTTYVGTKITLELNDSKKIILKSEYFSDLHKLHGALRKLRDQKKLNIKAH